jgi:RNA polymerase primary sigma factor
MKHSTNRHGPPDDHSYLVGIAHRRLDDTEERALIVATKSDDPAVARSAADTLIRHNLKFAMKVARHFAGKYAIDLSDLQWIAVGGLFAAIKAYDIAFTVRFTTYSHYWIRQHISVKSAHFNNAARVPYRALAMARRVEGGRPPINDACPNALRRARATVALVDRAYSIDPNEDRAGKLFVNSVPVDPSMSPQDAMILAETKEQIAVAVGRLSPHHRYIIENRFGLDGREVKTLADLGAELDLSRERVRQIELKSLAKLARWMTAKQAG